MNKTLLRSLLLGACCAAPLAAVAGGVDVAPCCTPPRVDIPDMREGWGFYLEGAAIRAYNNDLSYALYADSLFVATVPGFFGEGVGLKTAEIRPDFNFDLRVGVDYTLANSANIIKLTYEHLFNSTDSSTANSIFGGLYGADVKVKLDAVSLVSEQHILIGPYWEATLTGGLRYARVEQDFNNGYAGINHSLDDVIPGVSGPLIAAGYKSTMQYNGVGPIAGVGGMFHLTENFALGAEGQAAILLGRSDLTFDAAEFEDELFPATPFIFGAFPVDTRNETTIVPELIARIYGNYFYRFNDGMELQVELGWRLDQYFNLKARYVEDVAAEIALGDAPFHDTPAVISDDIGFSGPYLSAHLKI